MQDGAMVLTLDRQQLLSMDKASDARRWALRLAGRARRRRRDLIAGGFAVASAALALPFTTASPEAASVLAVSAMALLAGQRWALGVVIVAELMLLRALLPLAMQPPPTGTWALWASIAAAVPSLLSLRRGAAALALLIWRRRTRATCRVIHAALIAFALLCGCGPWI